jgi:phosphoglycolate phosphatase-like HAD superfamily hydrolase
MKFKGLIFDLDGTLVNSLEDSADSTNSVLSGFDYPVHELSSQVLICKLQRMPVCMVSGRSGDLVPGEI